MRALLQRPVPGPGRGAARSDCRNVLFVCSMVCLLMLIAAKTIPMVRFDGSIGLLTPTTVFFGWISFSVHGVTPKNDRFAAQLDRRQYE